MSGRPWMRLVEDPPPRKQFPEIIDGIETAFTYDDGRIICPCGWKCFDWVIRDLGIDANETLAGLRFHFTHCHKARPASETEGS